RSSLAVRRVPWATKRKRNGLVDRQKSPTKSPKKFHLKLVARHYTFTARALDTETGLMYYRARYYSTAQGRFVGRDPERYVDGMNLYAAYFAPNKVDPLGLDWWEWVPGFSVGGHYLQGKFGHIEGTDVSDYTKFRATRSRCCEIGKAAAEEECKKAIGAQGAAYVNAILPFTTGHDFGKHIITGGAGAIAVWGIKQGASKAIAGGVAGVVVGGVDVGGEIYLSWNRASAIETAVTAAKKLLCLCPKDVQE
ncbi:MAG: RHS repeat-associated core domain-containing protein, partial [Planctomycetota bacterium]